MRCVKERERIIGYFISAETNNYGLVDPLNCEEIHDH